MFAVSQEPGQPATAGGPRESSRLWLVPAAVAAAVIGLLVIAVAIFVAGIGKHDISGSYMVVASDPSIGGIETTDAGCRASGRPASSVLTVEDGGGKTLSSTTLGQGTLRSTDCEWRFTLTGVPEVSTYVFKVDTHTVATLTLEQLQATNWSTGFAEDVAPPPADLNF